MLTCARVVRGCVHVVLTRGGQLVDQARGVEGLNGCGSAVPSGKVFRSSGTTLVVVAAGVAYDPIPAEHLEACTAVLGHQAGLE